MNKTAATAGDSKYSRPYSKPSSCKTIGKKSRFFWRAKVRSKRLDPVLKDGENVSNPWSEELPQNVQKL